MYLDAIQYVSCLEKSKMAARNMPMAKMFPFADIYKQLQLMNV